MTEFKGKIEIKKILKCHFFQGHDHKLFLDFFEIYVRFQYRVPLKQLLIKMTR